MIQEDEFLEYAEYVGNFYGTPKRYVDEAMAQGKDVILRYRGAGRPCKVITARARYRAHPSSPLPRGTLEQRSTGAERTAPRRSRSALPAPRSSFRPPTPYDYFVINDTVENAVREINAIMLAEHCRLSERMEILQ